MRVWDRFVMENLRGDNMDTVVYDPERGPIGDVECIKAARNILAALKVAGPATGREDPCGFAGKVGVSRRFRRETLGPTVNGFCRGMQVIFTP